MTFEDAADWVNTLDNRTKKLDSYRDTIFSWFKENIRSVFCTSSRLVKGKLPIHRIRRKYRTTLR